MTLEESPLAEDSAVAGPVTAEVVSASVGRSMTLGVTVRQPLETVAVNHLDGVVTAVGGGEISAGDVIYEVADTPVAAVQGERPFYRDLVQGDSGEDVAQLQQALVDLGHMNGDPDARFGAGTAAAVRAWQEELGLPRSGTIPLGQLVALPSLPAAVSVHEEIVPGSRLGGGEPAVRAPSGQQAFVLTLAANQQSLVPVGASVMIPYQDTEWEAVVASSAVDTEFGQLEMELTAPDGGAVCGQDCTLLPADETFSILSTVIAVPPVEGPGVPAAAVHSRVDASTYVVLADGTERDVTVLGTGQGLAIVEGVSEGQHVQLSAAIPPESSSVDQRPENDAPESESGAAG